MLGWKILVTMVPREGKSQFAVVLAERRSGRRSIFFKCHHSECVEPSTLGPLVHGGDRRSMVACQLAHPIGMWISHDLRSLRGRSFHARGTISSLGKTLSLWRSPPFPYPGRLTHRRPIRKISPLESKRDLEVTALIRCPLWSLNDSDNASLAHQVRFICNLDAYSFRR